MFSVPPLDNCNVTDDRAILIVSEEPSGIYHDILTQSTGGDARWLSQTDADLRPP